VKRSLFISIISILIATAGSGLLAGQETNPDRIAVAFSDPSRPGLLKVHMLQGSISVKAYNGKEVIIVSQQRVNNTRSRSRSDVDTQGLRRLDTSGAGLVVDEANNVMTIGTDSWNRSGNLDIQVPTTTNLQLKTVNGGAIVVEGVDGDIEADNNNGSVALNDVAGSVVAHSLNGKVTATLKRVTPQKAMSFSSLNGTVDVTLPADVKANVKLVTDNGDVWTDFDIQLKANPPATVRDNRSQGGRIRIERDRSILGTINGGGPDFQLQSMNGNIYIRKIK